MQKLREALARAVEDRYALGHFNISNLEALKAIFSAARKINLPVIIGVSEGERDFIGVRQAVALVRSLREEHDFPIFINADHTYSLERAKEAIVAGFDAVIIDGAKLTIDENIALTKEAVEYARSVDPEIIVEGELGYIGTSSKLLDHLPEGVDIEAGLTEPHDAARFVADTGVDLFAPAVGNVHGMIDAGNPHLDIDRIKNIKNAVKTPLVLHGGSGISDDDFVAAIEAGISIIHINTELRVAYRRSLQLALQEQPEEVAPYKFLKHPVADMASLVEDRLALFSRR